MSEENVPPFHPGNIFFPRIELRRPPEVQANFEVPIRVGIRVVDKSLPDCLEVQMKVETEDEQPLTLRLLVIGQFRHVEGVEIDDDIIRSFVIEQACPAMWAQVEELVEIVSSRMGIPAIQLPPPQNWP